VSQGKRVHSTRCFHAAPLSIIARGRPERLGDVPDAVLAALADVRTLETLKLCCCPQVRDVSALARSVSLRELDLSFSAVSDAGIAGLELIPSLTSLSLRLCRSITNVTNLFRSKSLRRLDLSKSSVTDAGLVGLELAPALEFVDVRNCHVSLMFPLSSSALLSGR
jgi:hypothetical protein